MNESLILLLASIAQVFAARNDSPMTEYVMLAAQLLESGKDVNQELIALATELQGFIDTGTEPTAEDFDRVAARRRDLIEQLHNPPGSGGIDGPMGSDPLGI